MTHGKLIAVTLLGLWAVAGQAQDKPSYDDVDMVRFGAVGETPVGGVITPDFRGAEGYNDMDLEAMTQDPGMASWTDEQTGVKVVEPIDAFDKEQGPVPFPNSDGTPRGDGITGSERTQGAKRGDGVTGSEKTAAKDAESQKLCGMNSGTASGIAGSDKALTKVMADKGISDTPVCKAAVKQSFAACAKGDKAAMDKAGEGMDGCVKENNLAAPQYDTPTPQAPGGPSMELTGSISLEDQLKGAQENMANGLGGLLGGGGTNPSGMAGMNMGDVMKQQALAQLLQQVQQQQTSTGQQGQGKVDNGTLGNGGSGAGPKTTPTPTVEMKQRVVDCNTWPETKGMRTCMVKIPVDVMDETCGFGLARGATETHYNDCDALYDPRTRVFVVPEGSTKLVEVKVGRKPVETQVPDTQAPDTGTTTNLLGLKEGNVFVRVPCANSSNGEGFQTMQACMKQVPKAMASECGYQREVKDGVEKEVFKDCPVLH